MEQNSIHILKEKIKEHEENLSHADFRRRRSMYADHLLDMDQHQAEVDEERRKIQKLQGEIELIRVSMDTTKAQGTNYISCIHCDEKVHFRRVRAHKCKVTPAFMFNKRLYS